MTVVEDLVCRKWVLTSSRPKRPPRRSPIVFTDALAAEGSVQAEARADGLVDPSVDDPAPSCWPCRDKGPQMTSGSTREFMALCAIACHFGRPGTPSDHAWIESLFGHVKTKNPHLLAISDPAVLRAELAVVRSHCNGMRLHSGMGYVCLDAEHEGKGQTIRKARRPARGGPTPTPRLAIDPTARQHRPRDPAMLANQLEICDANSGTRQPLALVVALWPAVRTHPALHFID